MPTKRLFFLVAVLCLILLFVIAFLQSFVRTEQKVNVTVTPSTSSINVSSKITAVQFADTNIPVTLASTVAEQQRGLSGRTSLGANEGMLFVFPVADTYGFWMKEMKFSLDIIWIDENGVVTYIARDLQPNSFPQVFNPDQKSLYVLEVNAGFAASHAIKVGDQATFITN